MKKFFGLLTVFMLIGTLSFAQETMEAPTETRTFTCVAPGMSVDKGEATGDLEKPAADIEIVVAEAKLVAQESNAISTNITINCDPVECAKLCGMTVAECQKYCGSKSSATQNVDVKLVTQESPAKPCCKAKCCKKS